LYFKVVFAELIQVCAIIRASFRIVKEGAIHQYTPEQINKPQEKRMLEDAEAINGGACLVEEGLLYFTQEQRLKAAKEMRMEKVHQAELDELYYREHLEWSARLGADIAVKPIRVHLRLFEAFGARKLRSETQE
jgi:hypothetical protein